MGLRSSAWKARFRKGSFRGAAFFLRSHQKEGGRRVQDHEFPQLEQNRAEDLGRKIGRFTLDMYVIADDYFPARDALEAALNREGSGELIHPYLGRMTVQAGTYTLSEAVDEGRMARFSVRFSEAGAAKFPEQVIDSITNVTSSADSVVSLSTASFVDAFDVLNTPAFVVQSAADSVGKVADFMDLAVKKVTEPISNLTFALRNLKANAEDLVQKPQELADRFVGIMDTLFNELADTPQTTSDVLTQFKDLDDEFEVVPGDTPSREKERLNQSSIIDLNKDLAFSTHAKAAASTGFGSTQEALAERDDIVESLDDRATEVGDNGGDDDLFQSNKDLQSALVKAVPQAGLSELIRFTPPKALPALVIVHTIFGDVNKEQELIDQNGIEHPGFTPGGEQLEISNG